MDRFKIRSHKLVKRKNTFGSRKQSAEKMSEYGIEKLEVRRENELIRRCLREQQVRRIVKIKTKNYSLPFIKDLKLYTTSPLNNFSMDLEDAGDRFIIHKYFQPKRFNPEKNFRGWRDNR